MCACVITGEVPALKEFLHEANEDQAREEEVLEKQSQVAVEDQVYKDEYVRTPFVPSLWRLQY